MIKLTRLDKQPFVLNADLIRYVEERPDTFVTLVSGERIVVRESMDDVVDRAVEYQQRKAMLPTFAAAANTAPCATTAPTDAIA
ncbi:MAG TPA: flagellar protein FlbD [Planctomycetaceae bacterium]|nr:flagellar protein FlbD [Planctomycetaceae bacterium]